MEAWPGGALLSALFLACSWQPPHVWTRWTHNSSQKSPSSIKPGLHPYDFTLKITREGPHVQYSHVKGVVRASAMNFGGDTVQFIASSFIFLQDGRKRSKIFSPTQMTCKVSLRPVFKMWVRIFGPVIRICLSVFPSLICGWNPLKEVIDPLWFTESLSL